MTKQFHCTYLHAEVELSDERLAHIQTQHPELPENHENLVATTISDPDEVRSDP